MPPLSKDLYLPWLDMVESEKQDSWRALGIYDVIQLSRYNMSYNFPMIMSSLFFWDRATSSFHVPCAMITPTLFDVAAIAGLRPTGPSFRPDSHPKNPDVTPNFQKLSYQLFITLNMNRDGPITDEEHVAFLMFWLSAYVFCSRSLQVPKTLLTLAQLLHEESSICLGKLILGNLYENLNEAVASFRSNDFPSVISGPFWLLQLWLNAIFEEKLQSSEPLNISREIEVSLYQVVAYQPNLVARQFGLGQLKPSLMLEGSNLDILENARKSIDDLNEAISFFRKRRTKISPLDFKPIFYCTSTFQSWWSTYYLHPEISIEACNQNMTSAFSLFQKGDPKAKTRDFNISRNFAALPTEPFVSRYDQEDWEEDEPLKKKQKSSRKGSSTTTLKKGSSSTSQAASWVSKAKAIPKAKTPTKP
ncbi:uncharacterized protein LOC113850902 [Abrus precatorius]|uniref:Uncharacterized protein LOC113850902 n=1 Tax=Abrus precatorius TaxID=3816 RepID=A0A8B8K0B9_ABRPR|nr:uncharacterized protein LOC113850902 [Abrus precatorius]